MLNGEELAGSTESTLNLISNKEDPVLGSQLA